MNFGKFQYNKMEQANQTLVPFFYFPYIIVFFFIVMSFFTAIIMNTYDQLRQRKQLVTDAMAGLLAYETRKQKTIWMNLIFCRTSNANTGQQDYLESSSDSDEDTSRKTRKKSKLKSKQKQGLFSNDNDTDQSMISVFIQNFSKA